MSALIRDVAARRQTTRQWPCNPQAKQISVGAAFLGAERCKGPDGEAN